MEIHSAYPQRELTFSTLAIDVTAVRLNGDRVEGQGDTCWALPWSDSPRALVEKFANWGDTPKEIIRFTRKYGPVGLLADKSRRRFSFPLDEWRTAQRRFRDLWKKLVYRRGDPIPLAGRRFASKPGEGFSFYGGQWEYRASTLERLLRLQLLAIRADYLRVCAQQGCQNPFFLARDSRQEYCSDICSNEAQKASKRQWWREKGDGLRRKRAAQAKKRRRTTTRSKGAH